MIAICKFQYGITLRFFLIELTGPSCFSSLIGFVNQKLKTVFDIRELSDELLDQCLLFVILLTISNVHNDITHIRLSLHLALSFPLIYTQ